MYCGRLTSSCFECVLTWFHTQKEEQRCPLCKTPVGPYILHALDPKLHQYLVHTVDDKTPAHVPATQQDIPEDSEEEQAEPPSETPEERRQRIRRREERRNRICQRNALLFRRHVYRHHLYAKHVPSNRYTKYRPYPGPMGFRKNPALARLLSTFLQRELQVWPHLDREFLMYYIPAMLSHTDIRSDEMIEMLTDWIGSEDEARHLAHEMELFVRSGRATIGLYQYDTSPWLQYDHVE